MTDSINRNISRLARNVTASGTLTTDTVVAAHAARWTTPRNIVLDGDLSGSVTMDGSEHVTLTATISSDTVTLGTDTAGNYVAGITGGTGITVTGSGTETADVTVSIDNTVATLSGTETLTNKTISATNNTITIDTDNVSEGSTNLYYTDARARGAFSAGDNITIVEGVISGSASYTDTDARAAISVTDSGGDGSLAYNNTTGVITYTGPSASEVRSHFTGGTGVAITDGSISIGQDVGTSSNVTFNDLIVSGNLTVSGTTTTINTETINLADNTIVLNSNEAGSPTQNSGIEIERGTSTNVSLLWDETNDRWTIGTESFVAGSFIGNVTGNVTGTVSSLSNHNTDDVSEGSTNLYYTDARARAAFSAGSNITIVDGVISGSAAYGDSDARTAISVTDSGGDGSLSYNSTTGVITYTGPSASEVRSHFTAGSGINIVAGQISVASGFVENYTDADARAAISVSGGLSYNSSTGVITLSGYNNSNWDTAYGWGNHASAGYLTSLPSHTHSWDTITEGTRTDYGLKFKPNSGDYAGIQFLDDSGDNAGYLLIRSEASDNFPPYTAGGITLVSDRNSLNFFARGNTVANSTTKRIRMGVGSTEVLTLNDNYGQYSASSRAPIFYDSNNTAYYVDPNGTSVFNKLAINDGTSYIGGMSNGSLELGNIGRNYKYTSGWSTSMQAGILANCADSWEMIIHDSGDALASPICYNGGASNRHFEIGRDMGWGTMYTTLHQSARSPIFYDSNDTGYYVDPASTTRLNDVLAGGASSKATSWHKISIETGGFIAKSGNRGVGAYASSTATNLFSYDYGSGSYQHLLLEGSYVSSTNSHRAPIFYDSNNTAYYSDPASKGYFHRLGLHNYNGSTSSGNVTSLEIMNAGGTGDGGVAAMSFHCSGYYGMHMHLRHDSYFGIGGWSASTWRWYVQMSTGNMTAAGNVTAYSDIRLKENVVKLENSLDKIKKLNGVSFKWKDLPDVVGNPNKQDYGIIAQEVEKVFPEVIHESAHVSPDGDNYKTVAYDKLVPVLIEAIKEQQKLIEDLQNEMKNLR